LLLDGDFGPLNEKQVNSLEIISGKSNALVKLVNDIVMLNSVTPDTLQCEPIDLCELIEEAVKGAEAAANSRGLQVEVEVPARPQVALVDPHRLNQVIDNLLDNAMKFSEDGGHIVARVVDRDEQVRLEIEDQGVGIPPEAQARVFERFFQGKGGRQYRGQGVGLGLAISKQIVEAHGGIIGVESIPGKGSLFHFQLEKHRAG
jgi:signal transduction histidine kinase